MPEDVIFHYRLLRKLGAGGMGEVYLAEDRRLERQVALKLLPAELAGDALRRQRFMTEAKAASALNHPNVCVVHEVGETTDHRPYIVMEHIEGGMLDDRIKSARLSVEEMVTLGVQVADALEAAHSRGVIHRDIKPSNISYSERGTVKVLDFGLAKRTRAGLGMDSQVQTAVATQAGQVMGTPSYMSPEQALGRAVDGRSDLFSLGVVFYELATGQLPFEGDNLGEVLDKIVHGQPVAVARLNYDVPEELERIIRKCLEKDPDRRYQGARELLVDLRNLQRDLMGTGVGTLSRTVSAPAASGQAPTSESVQTSPVDILPPSPEEIEKSDLFINCSQVDDRPLYVGRSGWVSEFQKHLSVRLEQLFGEEVKVCAYPQPTSDSVPDERLLASIGKVKAMLSVVSPPFVKSSACQRELQAFWRQAEESGTLLVASRPRIFKVLKTPVSEREMPPMLAPVLSRLLGYEFFEQDPVTGRVREFDETFGQDARQKYFERIYDLARELSLVLSATRQGGEVGVSPRLPVASNGKVVYLATTSSDLKGESDRIRRELEALGHTVLPDKPLPLVGEEMEQAVRSSLRQCHLVIHPIGRSYGLIPEGADVSVIELQLRLAGEHAQQAGQGTPRLLWIPDRDSIVDGKQQAFIRRLEEEESFDRGTELIEDTLENLKDLVLKRLNPPEKAKPVGREASGKTVARRVYLIHDVADQEAVEPLEDFLFDQGLEVSVPDFQAGEEDAGRQYLQNMEDCDGVLIYYGAARYAWVDTKLRALIKAQGLQRDHPILAQAVYVAPPLEDRRKQRFRSHLANVYREGEGGFDPDLLQDFVTSIKASTETS